MTRALSTPHVTAIDIFGHSGAQPYGLADEWKGFGTRLANMAGGADEKNHAVVGAILSVVEGIAGTSANGGWGRLFDLLTTKVGGVGGEIDASYMPQRDWGVFFYGSNDLTWMGPANSLASDPMVVFTNCLRTCIARYRCSRIFEDSDFASGTATTSNTGQANQITSVSITTGTAAVGMYIRGTGIQSGTYVQAINGAVYTLSKDLTAGGGAGTTITLGTVAYTSGVWTPVALPSTGSRNMSGSSVRFATADTNAFTITVPADFEGGGSAVVLGFVQDNLRNSAQWTVTVDGVAPGTTGSPNVNGVYSPQAGAGTYDFRDANYRQYPSTPSAQVNALGSCACVRLLGLAAGTHTIVVTAAAHSGTNPGYFDWWGMESNAYKSMVTLLKHPQRPSAPDFGQFTATGTTSGTGNQITSFVPSAGQIINGMWIQGTGIPANTTITAGAGTGTLTLSNNLNGAGGAGTALTFAGSPFFTQNSDITGTLNPIFDALAKEFDRFVWTFDTDRCLQQNVNYFLQSTIGSAGHANEEGHYRLARELWREYQRRVEAAAHASPDQRAAVPAFGFISQVPNDSRRNQIQTGDYTQAALLFKNALGQDLAHTLAGGAAAKGNNWELRDHDSDAVIASLAPDGTLSVRTIAYTLTGGATRPAYVFRTENTFAVQGTVTVITLPGFFVSKSASQAINLVKVRYEITGGTNVTFKVQKNGADLTGYGTTGSPLTATTTAAETASTQALADNDLLTLVLVAVSGSPANLSVSAVLEHTVT